MKSFFQFIFGLLSDCLLFGAFAGCTGAASTVHPALAVIVGYVLFVPMLVFGTWSHSYAIEGKTQADKAFSSIAHRWPQLYAAIAPIACAILLGSFLTKENAESPLMSVLFPCIVFPTAIYGLWAFAFMIGGKKHANEMFRFAFESFRFFPRAVIWLFRRLVLRRTQPENLEE